jgi:hypothetical protein
MTSKQSLQNYCLLFTKVIGMSGKIIYTPNITLLYPGFVTRLTRRVPLVEQKLVTLPEHLRSSRFLAFSGIRVTRSLVLCDWYEW